MSSELISIRPYNDVTDKSFILATMLRGMYHGSSYYSRVPKDIFMSNYHKIAENLLADTYTTVTIACLSDDPEVILGYAIFKQVDKSIVLDYVFVKSAWRKIGIAKKLVAPEQVSAITQLTDVGAILMKTKLPNAVFNPFLL